MAHIVGHAVPPPPLPDAAAAAAAAAAAVAMDHHMAHVPAAAPVAAPMTIANIPAVGVGVGVDVDVGAAAPAHGALAVFSTSPGAAVPHVKPEGAAPDDAALMASRKRGRPPNINENSLIRRLECVLLVESGAVPLKEACDRYAISPRTFYRWLSSKDRLVALTGHNAASVVELQKSVIASEDGRPGHRPLPPHEPSEADLSGKRRMPAAPSPPADAASKHRMPVAPRSRGARPAAITPPRRKTRVSISHDGVTVPFGFHEGLSSEDIRETLRRRFGLAPGFGWALTDEDADEVVISASIPPGAYAIKLLGNEEKPAGDRVAAAAEDAAAAAVAAAADASAAAARANAQLSSRDASVGGTLQAVLPDDNAPGGDLSGSVRIAPQMALTVDVSGAVPISSSAAVSSVGSQPSAEPPSSSMGFMVKTE